MSSHIPYVTSDVVATLNERHVPFGNDLSQTFTTLMGGSNAAFEGFLGALQVKLNADAHLALTTPFNWKAVPPSPPYTFATYFFPRSINEFILGLDKILPYSPYV